MWSGTTSQYFAGSIDEAAVYPTVLTAAKVTNHYNVGRTGNLAPIANFTGMCDKLACTVNAATSSDPDGTIASYAWNFGDGSNAAGVNAAHTYASGGAVTVTLTVTDNGGATAAKTLVLNPVVNQLPTAVISGSCTYLVCPFSAASSTDPDGELVSYAWNFGDGSTGTGSSAPHTYAVEGTYTVALTVTDNNGGSATTSTSYSVVQAPNQLPTASVTGSCAQLVCAFSGAASSDPDGSLVSYAWDFGDSTTGVGVAPSHTFATAGSYVVALTVTDNRGGTATSTLTLNPLANQAPSASLSGSCAQLVCSLNGSASTDVDGTIASYAWDFGDGVTGSGATASHTYASQGSYVVTLVVTDNNGAPGTSTLTLNPLANQAPTATYTQSCTNIACNFNASASSDVDGTIASYDWNFGDASTGSGATISHTFPAPGIYPVTLTVTDNNGAIGIFSLSQTVYFLYATDSFSRVVTGAWGTADFGGAWTTTTASNYAVNGGSGNITMATVGSGPAAYLNGVSASNTEVAVSVATDKAPTGGGITESVIGRRIIGVSDYRGKVHLLANGTVGVALSRVSSTNVETVIKAESIVASLSYVVGDQLRVRLQVAGTNPTTLRLRVWKLGQSEPVTWTATATDATATLQLPGGVGLMSYLSGSATNAPVVARFDDLWVGWNG